MSFNGEFSLIMSEQRGVEGRFTTNKPDRTLPRSLSGGGGHVSIKQSIHREVFTLRPGQFGSCREVLLRQVMTGLDSGGVAIN